MSITSSPLRLFLKEGEKETFYEAITLHQSEGKETGFLSFSGRRKHATRNLITT